MATDIGRDLSSSFGDLAESILNATVAFRQFVRATGRRLGFTRDVAEFRRESKGLFRDSVDRKDARQAAARAANEDAAALAAATQERFRAQLTAELDELLARAPARRSDAQVRRIRAIQRQIGSAAMVEQGESVADILRPAPVSGRSVSRRPAGVGSEPYREDGWWFVWARCWPGRWRGSAIR